MKTQKSKKWIGSVAGIAVAILVLGAYQATAQIRIGRITVTIPDLPKPRKAEKPPAPTPRPAEDSSATSAGDSSATTRGEPSAASSASGPSIAQSDPRLEILLEEIEKRKKEVESFDPAEGRQIVTMSTPEMFLPAISQRARAAYFKRDKLNERQQAALNPALDSLAASAAKKLPLYKPDGTLFAFHNPAAELMMKQSLQNAATLKVHRSGIKEGIWLIEKNDFGIPVNRYKHGYIWARDSSDDHPYCHLYTIYVQQNYAGGGAYGQLFAHLFDSELVGCP
jgi:hypothetical protein